MERVILRDCPKYDPAEIEKIVSEGIGELGYSPKGRVFLKPNAVFAARYARNAYTHPAVIEGVVRALKGYPISELILGENSGLMVPTRYVFERAGYLKFARSFGVHPLFLDEEPYQARIELKDGKVHEWLRLPKILLGCEDRVFIPKLKLHCQTGLSGALKLSMGLVDRPERLLGHNYQLDGKLVDLYRVTRPGLIVVDGVVIGVGGAGAPKGFELGLIVIGRNSVAVDAVCARILGLDPRKVEHIRLGYELGYGPIELREIEVVGDIQLTDAADRARAVNPLDPLTLFPQIRTFCGKSKQGWDGCPGGCRGFLEEALYFNHAFAEAGTNRLLGRLAQRLFNPRSWLPKCISVVVGDYRGELPPGPVMLVGDCARISDPYRPRVERELRGCPVYMGRLSYSLAQLSGIPNPWLDPYEAYPFLRALLMRSIKGCLRA